MSSKLPTVKHTWEILENVRAGTAASTLDSYQKSMHGIKEALTGFSTNPWTVVSSSDGANYTGQDGYILDVMPDESGNGNDGIHFNMEVSDVTSVTPGGSSTSSTIFDGTNEFIVCGDGTGVLDFEYTDPFSISCWFRVDGGGIVTILGKEHASLRRGYRLDVLVAGQVLFKLSNSFTIAVEVQTTATGFDDGNWHHVVATYDGSGLASGAKIYMNSIDEALTIVQDDLAAGTISTTEAFNISGIASGFVQEFNGAIDDVAIYNKELTASEVETIYNTGVARFSFSSMDLDGSNEHIVVGNVAALQFERTDTFSLSAWIKQDVAGTDMIVCKLDASAPNSGYDVFIDSTGNINLEIINDVSTSRLQIETVHAFTDNEWHHVVATWDGDVAGGVLGANIYVDGTLEPVTTIHNTLSGSIATTTPFQIGARDGANFPFDGHIDDVAVYNKELSADEVVTIYNNSLSTKFSSNSMVFDGVDEHIVIGDVTELQFERTDPFSLSVWFKQDVAGLDMLISKLENTSPFPGYEIYVVSTGEINFQLLNDTTTNLMQARTFTTFNDDHWHHVLCTWDGDVAGGGAGARIYVDGVSQRLNIIQDTLTGSIANTAPFQIGARDGTNFPFDGRIDDVAVYDRVLTPSEVATIYNSGDPNDLRITGPTANLVGYWRMGDGATFPTIPDDSTNSNNGTATNMESTDIINDVPLSLTGPRDLRVVGPTANLVGYWRMGDSASFPTIPDDSVNSNDGTATNMESTDITTDVAIPAGAPNDLISNGPTDNLVGYWLMGEDVVQQAGADLWIHPSKLTWATEPTPHSWIVLQHPTRNTQFCMNCNWTGSSGRHASMYVSFGGKYVGGDTTNKPTAVDEIEAGVQQQWLGPMTGAFSSWVHAWQSDDGSRTRVLITIATTGARGGYYLFDEIDSSSPNWEQREIALIGMHKGTSGGNVLDNAFMMSVSKDEFSSSLHPNKFLDSTGRITALSGPLKDTSVSHFSEGSTFFNKHTTSATEHVVIGDVTELKFERTDPFSISAWIRTTETIQLGMIVSKLDNTAPNQGYEMAIQGDGTIYLQLINDAGGNRMDITTVDSFNDGMWHHVVATYSGNSIAASANIYVDGELVSATVGNDTLTATIDGTTPFQIGGRDGGNFGFIGNLDDVAVYDKELTPEEIATIYNAGNSLVQFTTNSLLFDGVDETLRIGDIGTFKFDVGDAFSISAWFKTKSSVNQSIVAKRSSTAAATGYEVQITAGGLPIFQVIDDVTVPQRAFINDINGTDYADGLWHHIVATKDTTENASGMRLYIDGVDVTNIFQDTFVSGGGTSFDTTDPLEIGGRSGVGAPPPMNGNIDDVAIYDKELSAAEVTAIYNSGNPRLNTLLPSASNLVGYWRMGDGASSPLIPDALVIPGSNDYSPLTTSLLLDGADERVDFGNFTEMQVSRTTPMTVVAWFKTTAAGFRAMVGAKTLGTEGWSLEMNASEQLRFDHRDSLGPASIVSSVSVNDGQWHFGAGAKGADGDSANFELWLDSGTALTGGSVIRSGINPNPVDTSATLRVGAYGTTPQAFWDGNICHIAVWNGTKLTNAQMTEVYGGGVPQDLSSLPTTPAPDWWVALGDGDAIGASNVLDLSGNANHGTTVNVESGDFVGDIPMLGNFGTMTNMESTDIVNSVPFAPVFTTDGEPSNLRLNGPTANLVSYWLMGDGDFFPGVFDNANFSAANLLFDGVDEFVLVGDATPLKFSDTDSFSISAWIRSSSATTQIIADKFSGTSGYRFRLQSSGSLLWQLFSGSAQIAEISTTATGFGDGFWHHVVATYNGSGAAAGMTIYVDGSLEPTSIGLDGLAGTIDTTEPFRIGDGGAIPGADVFNGNIDDVAVYNKVLTGGEVTTIYNSGLPNDLRLNGPTANLVGYWQMGDDAAYPIIPDDSINNNDGTMTNMEIGDIVGNGNSGTCTNMTREDLGYGDTPGNPMLYLRLGAQWADPNLGTDAMLHESAAAAVANELDGFPRITDLSASDNTGFSTNMEIGDIRDSLLVADGIPDLSRSKNAGTPTNMESTDFTTDTPGGISKYSATFDGVNEYVDMGFVSEVNFEQDEPFSVSCWFKSTTTSGSCLIQAREADIGGASDRRGWGIILRSVGTIRMVLSNDDNPADNASLEVDTTTAWNDGSWHHVVTTWDGNGSGTASGITIYVDGVSQSLSVSSATLGAATIQGSGPLNIARFEGGPAYLDGQMDEVSVYNKELSAAEVTTIYNSGAPNDLALLSTSYNLVGWWRMGDLTQGGQSTKAMDFDGANEAVEIGNVSEARFERTDPFSVSAWINTTTNSTDSIVSKMENGTGTGYELLILSTGQIGFRVSSVFTTAEARKYTTATTWPDGNWHHVVGTWDGDASPGAAGINIYIDGEPQATSIIFDTLGTASIATNIPLWIGARQAANVAPFADFIDDVSIYDKELTLAEVRTIYGSEQFSEKSLLFDGVNEYVGIGDVTELKFERTDPFSISCWFKTTSVAGGYVVNKRENGAPNRGYAIFISTTGEVEVLIQNQSTNRIYVETTAAGFNDGVWHNAIMTYDGSSNASGVSIYVDGNSEALNTNDNTLSATIDSTAIFSLGSANGASNFFDGSLDDAAVYNKELSAAEVSTIFNGGRPPDLRTTGPTVNLVGYWRMGDDATFPAIPDDSTNSNDGTMTNMESGDIVDDAPYSATGSPPDLTSVGPTANLVGYWRMGEDNDSPGYPISPISLFSDYGYNGHHGFIDDLWWGSEEIGALFGTPGSTFPNDPDNRQFAQGGDIVHVWTGDDTLPQLGNTGATYDTYDAHFIDTSDVVGTGLVKYFQMTGIDSGAPSQPTYHSWVVTGTPDPTGALAVGPDAPPFGGPLVGIIVAAEWAD